MSLQTKERVYILEIRMHEQEQELKRLRRIVADLIEVVNVELKH